MQSERLSRAIDLPVVSRRAGEVAFWTFSFVIATALSAQVRIPIPGTPVPITLQTFFVLLAGIALGSRWGSASMLLYLGIGAAGLPVFTGAGAGMGHLTGLTAGYLLAYPAAAWVAGRISRGAAGGLQVWSALVAAELLILGAGTLWLSLAGGITLIQAAALGVVPFLVGDVIKLIAAAEVGRRLGPRL